MFVFSHTQEATNCGFLSDAPAVVLRIEEAGTDESGSQAGTLGPGTGAFLSCTLKTDANMQQALPPANKHKDKLKAFPDRGDFFSQSTSPVQ